MRQRRSIVLLFGLVLSSTVCSGADKPRANIILFLADDLGYMDIGANNPNTFYETPNINKLAEQGMRFTDAYAACPVCSPTRASLMTGKYPARVGVTDYIGGHRAGKLLPAPYKRELALEEVTLAEAFRDAGYHNFFAGKWHLGNGNFSPNAQGFGPGLIQKGVDYYPPASDPLPDPKDDPKSTDRIASEAVKFIDANKDNAFFAYLPFMAVHIPIGARQDLVEKYNGKKAPAEAWGKERKSRVREVQSNPKYAAMLEQMDQAVGRVLAAIERNGLKDRTIVIFASDNGGLSTAEGQPTSNLPLRGGKGWPYEGGIRVPWIISAPGVTDAGTTCSTPVTSTDFYPTLLELAGLPPKPTQHCDAMSLVPLLKGGKLARGPIFWHYPHYGNQGGAPCGAVRDGDWKLIEWFEDGSQELFNLRDDPGEKNNVGAAHPDKVQELKTKLVAWRKSVNAQMPTPNPHPGSEVGTTTGTKEPAE